MAPTRITIGYVSASPGDEITMRSERERRWPQTELPPKLPSGDGGQAAAPCRFHPARFPAARITPHNSTRAHAAKIAETGGKSVLADG